MKWLLAASIVLGCTGAAEFSSGGAPNAAPVPPASAFPITDAGDADVTVFPKADAAPTP